MASNWFVYLYPKRELFLVMSYLNIKPCAIFTMAVSVALGIQLIMS